MRKALFIVLLISLLVFEICLCTVFLPLRWQHEINRAIVHVLPEKHDWTPITHPMLEQEIEQVLREHIWLRVPFIRNHLTAAGRQRLGHLSTGAASPLRAIRTRKRLKAKARLNKGSNKVKQDTPNLSLPSYPPLQ